MLGELKGLALEVVGLTWPIIVISSVVACTLEVVYLKKNNKKFIIYKELFKLLFIVYILCLFQVVTSQDVATEGVNFIPFKEIFRYQVGSTLFYKNIIGNMVLFLPYGLFVTHFLELEKPISIFILSLFASISIEFTQSAIGRVFDVDDIILNILGAFFGYLIYKLLSKLFLLLPKALKKDWLLNVIALLIAIFVWSIFFL